MRIGRLHDRLTGAGAALGAGALGFIVVAYGYEVVARYAFAAPTEWASEFVPYLLSAGVFLLLPEMTRRKGHIAVTLVPDAAPPRAAAVLEVLALALAFIACATAGWISLEENLRQYRNGVQLAGNYVIPKWWVSALMTYGFVSAALHFLRLAWARARAGRRRAPAELRP